LILVPVGKHYHDHQVEREEDQLLDDVPNLHLVQAFPPGCLDQRRVYLGSFRSRANLLLFIWRAWKQEGSHVRLELLEQEDQQ
jgi:hypothetical protein